MQPAFRIRDEEANTAFQTWAAKWGTREREEMIAAMGKIVAQFFETRLPIYEPENGHNPLILADPLGNIVDEVHQGIPRLKNGNFSGFLYQAKPNGRIGSLTAYPEEEFGYPTPNRLASVIDGIENGFIHKSGDRTNILGLSVSYRTDALNRPKTFSPPSLAFWASDWQDTNSLKRALDTTHQFSQRMGTFFKQPLPVGLPKEALDELLNLLLPIVRKKLQANLDRFKSHLDPGALELMKTIGNPSVDVYNYLLPAGEIGKYRRDALKTFPFLADYVRESANKTDITLKLPRFGQDKPQDIGENIEGKQTPLIPLLSEILGASESVMRRMVGLPSPVFFRLERMMGHGGHHNGDFGSQPLLLPYMLSQCDINKVPFYQKTPQEFEAAAEALGACRAAINSRFRHLISKSKIYPKDIAGLMNNNQHSFSDIAKKYGGQPGQMVQAGQDVRDMLEAAIDVLVYPVITRAVLKHPALKRCNLDHDSIKEHLMIPMSNALFGEHFQSGLERTLALSAKWHTQEGTLEDRIRDVERKGEWLPLIPNTPVPESVMPGVHFVALKNARELRREGRHMQHCVGGYGEKCMRQPYHILSLRDAQDNSIMTVELAEEPPKGGGEKNSLRVVQQRGIKNADPSAEAKKSLEWLLREIEEERIPINYNAIRIHRQKLQDQTQSIQDICGFDPMDMQKCANAFSQYQGAGLIHKKYTSLEHFLTESGLQQSVDRVIAGLSEGKHLKVDLGYGR